MVARGRPAGGSYRLGWAWTQLDLAFVTGDPRSPAAGVSRAEAWKHYAVGPPLVMHHDDLAAIVAPWARFVPRVRAVFPKLLAEMFAYCVAAAHARLPHLRTASADTH